LNLKDLHINTTTSSCTSPFISNSVCDSFPTSYDVNRSRSTRLEPYQKGNIGSGNLKGGNFSPSTLSSPNPRFFQVSSNINSVQSNASTPYAVQTPNSSSYGVNNSNVVVGVRIRPLSDKEIHEESPISFRISDDLCSIEELNDQRQVVKLWGYDRAFGPNDNNEFICQQMGLPLVDAAIDGYNTVLFMYGQTASGKLYNHFWFDRIPVAITLQVRLTHSLEKMVNQELLTSPCSEVKLFLSDSCSHQRNCVC